MRKQLGQASSISSFFFFGHLSSTLDIESSLLYRTQVDYPFGCSKPISSHLREAMYLVDEANLRTIQCN
jgi:hypothetical protein